jgi:hypothetical protein
VKWLNSVDCVERHINQLADSHDRKKFVSRLLEYINFFRTKGCCSFSRIFVTFISLTYTHTITMRIKLQKSTALQCLKSSTPYTLERFEPTISCSVVEDDEHYTTPPCASSRVTTLVFHWGRVINL